MSENEVRNTRKSCQSLSKHALYAIYLLSNNDTFIIIQYKIVKNAKNMCVKVR